MPKTDKVFIIAEAGINYAEIKDTDRLDNIDKTKFNSDKISKAKQLIELAKDKKADAVKFQTFIPELEIDQSAERAEYQKENMGQGEKAEMSQLEMARLLELPQEDFVQLKDHADKTGIEFMSTPFDPVAVETLGKLGVERYKLSSCCLTNYPLLVAVAKKGKPVIISSGMSTLAEVDFGVQSLRKNGVEDKNISLLHCVSNYPAALENCNLLSIETLINKYPGITIGWSDHTGSSVTAVMAVALGAKVVEKHYTLDKNMAGPDHLASSSPEEFGEYVEDVRWAEEQLRNAKPGKELAAKLGAEILQKRQGKAPEEAAEIVKQALGDGKKRIMESEKETAKVAKRSLYSYGDIKKGQIIKPEDLLAKRPPGGILPTLALDIIGKRAACDIGSEQKLEWNMVEQELKAYRN